MRSLFLPSTIAILLVVLVRFAADPGNPALTFGVLIAVLSCLAMVDWLLTRHLEIISPVRVYLLLAIAAMGLIWVIYLFSYLGPVAAVSLAAGLGGIVGVLTLFRRPHTRRFREAAGLCVECGYDLRASTERCPECNAPLPESIMRRRRIASEIRATRKPSRSDPAESAKRADAENIGSVPAVNPTERLETAGRAGEEVNGKKVRPLATPPPAD
jgi:hypothetical protein